ncbi:MAG TPA: DinB family protein [Pseudonocardiaceae bacterium]
MRDEDRREPPGAAGELETLQGFLDFHRDTFVWKCAGLTDEQLRERPLPSSALSLLGLLRHLADVERSWFRREVRRDEDAPPIYYTEERLNDDFDAVDSAPVDEVWQTWRAEVARSDEIIASMPLDATFTHTRSGDTLSMRWLLVHMIEEYSRHNGHADLLRERLDGSTGE